ncbi:MAG TPA: sensor histidine kinase [Ruminococcaceae bacterium]|nr:sensor histidine kinase [Oscillospiraceae bacterium]
MKNRLVTAVIAFSLVIILIFGGFYFSVFFESGINNKSRYILDLNEIEQLNERGDYNTANEKIAELQNKLRTEEEKKSGVYAIPVLCGVSILFIVTAFGYIYFQILRPFEKMKGFAADISAGNFDIPLKYERSNYFGEFTWAFDSMRNEITKARSGEREAIENNKTVIATLSHDIKTPIASIRAYSEALFANMDTSFEKREKYISVILKKCDEVAGLTNDLFLHSVSDLDKLKISPQRIEICEFMESTVSEIGAERGDVTFIRPDFTAFVNADKNRLVQLCENIINNGRKYAKTNIDVSAAREDGNAALYFRDYGGGIPDENMPFIFDKFYRGSNCGSEQGSGLGLYIVKYIAEKSGGGVFLRNCGDGLEVKVVIPVAE